jgi:uncharacterized protein YjbJ (UPF0337 family)
MSGQSDQMKGRIKQAAGDLADDDRLRDEGERDEMAGKVKEKAESFKDKFDDAVDKVKDNANERT